jgi:hypothetical protein
MTARPALGKIAGFHAVMVVATTTPICNLFQAAGRAVRSWSHHAGQTIQLFIIISN